MRKPSASRAFTLIELMVAITIAVVIVIGLGIRSVRGVMAERRLMETFDRFDALARKAQANAVTEQRSWTLVWQQNHVSLQPDEPTPEELQTGGAGIVENLVFEGEETYMIQRPAALLPAKQTPGEWTFWRSGTCEPVIIGYNGNAGTWTAVYNPLTGRGEIIQQEIP